MKNIEDLLRVLYVLKQIGISELSDQLYILSVIEEVRTKYKHYEELKETASKFGVDIE